MLKAHLEGHRAHPDERTAILGYTTWHPELEVTHLMRYLTEIGQHLFSYPSLEPWKVLDFRHFWGGRSSAKRRFLVQHGSFNQDFTFGYEDIELAYRLSKHGLGVVYWPDAISYMLRPVTLDEFCLRCERQGQSLWHFAQLHDDADVASYCRVEEVLRDLRAGPDLAGLASTDNGEPLPDDGTLHELYDKAFRAALARGVFAAGGLDAGKAVTSIAGGATASTPPRGSVESTPQANSVRGHRLPEIAVRPIFIVGAPRSGTSVLAWALNEYTELRTFPETDFLYYLFGHNDLLRRVYDLAGSRPEHTFLENERVSWEEFLSFVGYGFNALMSSRSGGKRWVDQTPVHTLMTELLVWMFPDSQFVHILRDGRRVVASMLKFGERIATDPAAQEYINEKARFVQDDSVPWSTDCRSAAREWALFVERAMDFAVCYPDRLITVKNEELAKEPAAGFETIAAFLALENEKAPARLFGSTRLNSSFAPDGSPPPSGDETPWDTWTDQMRRAFGEEAGGMMVRVGYWSEDERGKWLAAFPA